MACNCKGRRAAGARGEAAPIGTWRVMVDRRKVYESPSEQAARTVAANFTTATVLAPGETL